MEGPLSVTLADIYLIRSENDVVKPLKPLFYKRCVCKKNFTDQLYHEFNNYLPNINLSIEINPKNVLDTQVITANGKIESAVYRKTTKIPAPWSLNIPKRYKQNAINADLHRSKRIRTNFDKKIYRIKKKFFAADYLKILLNLSSITLKTIK